jgi:DNA-binding beta-propeller fold protein YncE
MAGNGKYLYATLNGEGAVAKIDPRRRRVVDKVSTGSGPRSMAVAPDGRSLFVVNSSTMSQVRTGDSKVIQRVGTKALPIGTAYDAPTRSVWVCCDTGSTMVFSQV